MPVPLTSSSICCNNSEIEGDSRHHFFSNCKKSNDGRPPENVLKVSFKAIHDFNCTMMASFLTGIVIKRNKQIENNMPFSAVPHKFT